MVTTRRQILRLTAAAGAALATTRLTAATAKWPTRPIEVIIPFAPGDTDNMLRAHCDRLIEVLGQPAVMNFKPGAAGGLGASLVAQARPDGYTLVGTSQSSLVVVPLANKDISYTTESFAPVAALTEGGLMLLVNAKSPWKTLADLVAHSKQAPGTVTYGSSGMRGITHILAEMLAHEAEVDWNHVPMAGSTPAIVQLLGGHVDMASAAIAPALAHIQSGALRPLAVFNGKRLKSLPEVPTVAELGYSIQSPVIYGLSAPAGTPRPVIDTLYQALRKITDEQATAIDRNLATFGAQVNLMGPDEYGAFLQQQKALFAKGIAAL